MIHQLQKQLNKFVIDELLASDHSPYAILPFIRSKIWQFSLFSQYQESEIFIEAYLRAVNDLNLGKVISNLPAWFKLTTYNIIREYSKCQKSQRNLINKLKIISNVIDEIPINDYASESNLIKLRQTLQKLKPQENLILQLRIVKGLSWLEIGDYFVCSGQESENSPQLQRKLRKKGERAIKRLRKYYFSA